MLRRIALRISSVLLVAGLAACSSNDSAISIGPNFNTLSIYITNSTQNAVTIFAPNPTSASQPLNQIGGSNTQLNGPQYDTFDSTKKLYVSNINPGTNSGSITVYQSQATGNVLPLSVIGGSASALGSPRGIAVDSNSNIYVANVTQAPTLASSILVFAAGSAGNISPSSFIAGSNTGLNFPAGIFIDTNKKLWIANTGGSTGNGSILQFAITAVGNVAPANVISGPLTGLISPTSVILDAAGNIYVTDSTLNAILVFAPSASGNVAPVRTIAGAATKLNNPSDVLLDQSGNLLVTNTATGNGTGSILIFPSTASGNVAPAQTIAAPGNLVGLALSP